MKFLPIRSDVFFCKLTDMFLWTAKLLMLFILDNFHNLQVTLSVQISDYVSEAAMRDLSHDPISHFLCFGSLRYRLVLWLIPAFICYWTGFYCGAWPLYFCKQCVEIPSLLPCGGCWWCHWLFFSGLSFQLSQWFCHQLLVFCLADLLACTPLMLPVCLMLMCFFPLSFKMAALKTALWSSSCFINFFLLTLLWLWNVGFWSNDCTAESLKPCLKKTQRDTRSQTGTDRRTQTETDGCRRTQTQTHLFICLEEALGGRNSQGGTQWSHHRIGNISAHSGRVRVQDADVTLIALHHQVQRPPFRVHGWDFYCIQLISEDTGEARNTVRSGPSHQTPAEWHNNS